MIQYTERLHKVLVKRANHLKAKMRSLKGGAPRQRFFQQNWKLQLHPQEIQVSAMQQQIQSLEQQVAASRAEATSLSKQITTLGHRNRKLENKVCSLSQQRGEVGTRHRSSTKCYDNYSESHKRRLKRARSQLCQDSLLWLQQEGYRPLAVEVKNASTGKVEKIELGCDELQELFGPEDPITEENVDVLNMLLLIKDQYNISSSAYHELSQVCKSLPRSYKLKERIKELNSRWDIRPTPHGAVGFQQSLEERLRIRVQHLLKVSQPDARFIRDRVLRVKLSGDGTNIGKRLHVVTFTFTLLDEGRKAYSSEGNHILAVFKEPEKYESVKKALADITAEVERLNNIEVNGMKFRIDYHLGGDWKFLAMASGIDSACSKYACIWCKCPNDLRYDSDKVWSLTDTSEGARTIEETLELSQLPRSRKQFNVSNTPIFPTIPLTRVVIDNLHVSSSVRCVAELITELRRQDSIEKVKRFSSFDIAKYKHIQGFQEFITSLGIPGFEFYIGQSSKELKCRSLTGPEKLRVCQNIHIRLLLPNFPCSEASKIQHLWDELLQLNMLFSKPAEELSLDTITDFERRARKWGQDFICVYQTRNVTPYIHALMNHVGQFMRIHGGVLAFTQQGLEKLNDVMTKNFFRSSCHREEALKQLVEKQNRIERLNDSGSKRAKLFEVECSNCTKHGHNRLTCTEPCQQCGQSYCTHLVKVDGRKVPVCQQEN